MTAGGINAGERAVAGAKVEIMRAECNGTATRAFIDAILAVQRIKVGVKRKTRSAQSLT